MRTNATWLPRVMAMVVLGLAFAGVPLAQTTTTVDTRQFEVIAVDGNKLVVRDQKGTHEYTVAKDFRITVDGKSMAASDLKPGMKGTATVTTTTTVKPVVITEVKEGEVLRASNVSVTVRDADGQTKRYTQGELDQRGVQIVKDGKNVRLSDLKRGDKLSATIVTAGAPVVLTAQEVEATLVEAKADAAGTAVADATKQASQSAASTSSAKMGAGDAAMKTGEAAGISTTWWVLIAVLLALAIWFFMRRKKEP